MFWRYGRANSDGRAGPNWIFLWSASAVEERTVFQPSAVGSVRPGVRLNGIYEIEKLVAQGGMGEVYRGFNIQTGDVVAIKMIRPELEFLDNPDVSELFRREASILFNLAHEAIVRYFTFSIDPDIRRAYLAMEFVDGPSLTKRLASGPLPLDEVKILQSAHRFGPGGGASSGGHPSRHLVRQHHLAGQRREQSEGHRLRHRAFAAEEAATIIGGGFAGK